MRPVLEYACPVWHPGLTLNQSDLIESQQKRALRIIFPELGYSEALQASGLQTLADRRNEICKQLFRQMCHQDNKLHYLLPREKSTPYNLRSKKLPKVPKLKNKRYCGSFVIHALLNYQ